MAAKKKPAKKVKSLGARKLSSTKAKRVKGGSGYQPNKKWG